MIGRGILDRALEYSFCACNSLAAKRLILKSIRWEKPRNGWLTQNSDGLAAGNSGTTRGGGLIRDGNGEWVTGFARKFGTATSFLAELWTLQDGLLLCLQVHAQAVFIELDAKVTVDAFNLQTYSNTIVSSIMDDCRHLVTQIPQTRFKRVYREANRCADFLAKLGTSLERDFIVFSIPHVDLLSILKANASGL